MDPTSETTPLLHSTASAGPTPIKACTPIANLTPTQGSDLHRHELESLQESSSLSDTDSMTYKGFTECSHQASSSLFLEALRKHTRRFGIPTPNVSLTLENCGSVARDHLALERTFLAYVRTSLALTTSGVALVQLSSVASVKSSPQAHKLQMYIHPLGASTIVVGLLVLFTGVSRYFTVQAALMNGNFPVSRAMTGIVTLTLTVLVLLTFGILVSGRLEPRG